MDRPSAWVRFRGWPLLAQIALWACAWPIPVALYAASRPAGRRKPWWAVAAVLTVAYATAAVASQASKPAPVEQAGKVRETPAEARSTTTTTVGDTATTAASAATTVTSGPPASTAATTAKPVTTTTRPVPTPTTKPTPTTTTKPTPTTINPTSRGGGDALAQLRVAPEGPRAGYDRDLFQHWIDADGNSCDTREEVLKAESRTPAQVDYYGCKVVAGDWLSIYDGVTTDQPGDLDIDHVVALAEAWDSGASGWEAARRRDFANDLGYAGSLIAVTASSNRSKSDQDPAEWMPTRREAWCSFATDWVAVKVRWDLSADQVEVAALRTALDTCGGAPASPPPPAPAPSTTTTTTVVTPPPPAGGLTVTALDCGGERVVVGNGGSVVVDLTGWKIHDEGTKHTFSFPAAYTLGPGASVAVKSGGAAGPGELAWTGASVWNNDGDTAFLVNPGSAVISSRSC